MTNTTLRLLQNAYKTVLSSSITAIATSIVVDDAPDFAVPAGKKIPAVIDPKNNFRENIYITAISGTTLTVERGKPDYLGGASTANTHTGGAVVIISNHFEAYENLADCIDTKLDSNGGNPSTTFDLDLTGSAFRIRKDGNNMKFTDDSTSEVSLATLAAAAGTDTKVKISVADTTAGMLQGKINVGDGLDEAIGSAGGDETLDISVDVTDFIDTSYGLTEDTNNIRVNLAADPGLEFSGGALRAKIKTAGGITRDSDGLSLTQAFNPTLSFIAAETVATDDAVALMPYEVKWQTQLTASNLAFSNAATNKRIAIKIVPKVTTSSLTTMQFMAAEAVNGATALGDLVITIQSDTAGAPSGSVISNGTANTITQVTQRTWNTTQAARTATWATPPTLTAGTTYWIVFTADSFNATNYLNLGVNSSHDESFVTFTRLTYDGAAWGTSTTNATPFFWFNNQPVLLGMCLVPCDASWGGRTWSFVGFAKAGGAAEATVEVYYDTVPDLASLTPGESYYLSETAGAITTTPPGGVYAAGTAPSAFTYKVGRATSTTALKVEPGAKVVQIAETSALSATTTRNYATWFKPEIINVNGTGSGAACASTSIGVANSSGTNYTWAAQEKNGTASTIDSSTSKSLYLKDPSAANDFSGAASAFTGIGFTYTYTLTGTASMLATLEAKA